jgi:predicted NUDIX family NTP pyrophosphohydrolase
LCSIKQSGGKQVEVFAAEGDVDAAAIESIHFEMEWPPKSGRMQAYPEAEEARWMPLGKARRMMLPSQLPILDALEARLRGR